jgi:dolichol-phosphate mannosyltransferase
VPVRLLSFLAVGGLGVFVHLAVLGPGLSLGLSFLTAQILATWVAMTFNFALNNAVTYADRRLRGWALLPGLASFYAACGIGALANIGIGTWMAAHDETWWIAGIAGTIVGAVWNYAATSFLTWRK